MIARPAVSVFALALVLATPTVAARGTCDVEIDGLSHSADFELDAEIRFEDDDIVFERDDRIVARITPTNALYVDGTRIETDADTEQLIAVYGDTYGELVDDAKHIGVAGAKLGMTAAMRAVASIFTGGSDDVEAEIEAEAEEIGELAARLCDTVGDLRERHIALAAAVPEFGAAVPLKD